MTSNFWRDKRIVVTGGSGFLGSYLVKELYKRGGKSIIVPRSKEYDLTQEKSCVKATRKAQLVFHLAGTVGGIGFNQKNPATLFYNNLMMGVNIIESCRKNLVGKLVVIGTICSYPKHSPVPFKEDDLWIGFPEETNAPYGIAKKALIVQSQAYRQQYGMNIINLMPVNLFGPGDHFEDDKSHVIPALIKKFVQAKLKNEPHVTVWGTGQATREFYFVEDAAKAISDAAEKYNQPEPVNIGAGVELSIKDLAETIKNLVGFTGNILWDSTKPDGQPRRKLDTTRAQEMFGISQLTPFEVGLEKTIKWYLKSINQNGLSEKPLQQDSLAIR